MNHGSAMTQNDGPKISFAYRGTDGKLLDFTLSLYRGKNANVSLAYNKKSSFFRAAADLLRPFSVFVPGLAGIPLAEERRANSIVQTGIAQGDANLFLRNVLYRLEEDAAKKRALQTLMRRLFPGFQVRTQFDENLNQYIFAEVFLNGLWTPLELAGTGCLQALQLAAYVILYQPKLLLLDEPDAHLHPGNQKLLIDLLFSLTETADTQIILASHSRHVFDSIVNSPLGSLHWLSDGQLVEDEDADAGLLLELGALDRFSALSDDRPKTIVFAEDEKTDKLRKLLNASGWDLESVEFVSFNGVDNFEATRIVIDYFLGLSETNRVLVYRDGDCMTVAERAWATAKYEEGLPERAKIFISCLTDIEHFFCRPEHVAQVLGIETNDAEEILNETLQELQAKLASKITRKRLDLKHKILRTNPNRATTDQVIGDAVGFEFALGKLLLPRLEDKLRDRGYQFESLSQITEELFVQELAELAD